MSALSWTSTDLSYLSYSSKNLGLLSNNTVIISDKNNENRGNIEPFNTAANKPETK